MPLFIIVVLAVSTRTGHYDIRKMFFFFLYFSSLPLPTPPHPISKLWLRHWLFVYSKTQIFNCSFYSLRYNVNFRRTEDTNNRFYVLLRLVFFFFFYICERIFALDPIKNFIVICFLVLNIGTHFGIIICRNKN